MSDFVENAVGLMVLLSSSPPVAVDALLARAASSQSPKVLEEAGGLASVATC